MSVSSWIMKQILQLWPGLKYSWLYLKGNSGEFTHSHQFIRHEESDSATWFKDVYFSFWRSCLNSKKTALSLRPYKTVLWVWSLKDIHIFQVEMKCVFVAWLVFGSKRQNVLASAVLIKSFNILSRLDYQLGKVDLIFPVTAQAHCARSFSPHWTNALNLWPSWALKTPGSFCCIVSFDQ